MKKIALFAATLLSFALSAFAGPYDTWVNYRDVTVNTTPTGANVLGAVTDFPVLVRLTNASPATGSDVLSGALAGGADLRFLSGSGVALSYQIERWSASNAEIWVRVPVVAGNAKTKIRMYWGNGAAVTESNGAAVFDTANGYKAVWHFNGNNATGATEPDATINGFNLTQWGTNTNASPGTPTTGTINVATGGPIGLARTLNGGNNGASSATTTDNDWFQATGTASALEFGQDGTYTYSVWVTPSDNDANRTLLSKSDNNSTVKMTAAPINWEFTEYNQAGTQTNGWQGTNGTYSGDGVVTHIVGVRQGLSSKFYKDGVLVDSTISTSTNTGTRVTNQDFVIGRQATSVGTRYFAGTVDEVRVSNVARSADFAKLDYETQKAATTAVSLGTSLTTGARYTYVVDTLVGTVGTAITSVTPIVNATGLVSASVLPALPTGLSLNTSTGVISGTPTAPTALADYVVTAVMTGPDTTASTTVTIRVRAAALASFTYSQPDTATYYTGVAVAANNATVAAATGATVVDSFTVSPSLPAGLTLNATTGQITGTPIGAVAATNYLVTANVEAGSFSRNLRLTVSGAPTVDFTDASVSYEGGLAAAISPLVPATTGNVVSWGISPPLPAGLTFNTATGSISGTPTAGAVAANYTITATNPAGSGSDIVNITVTTPEDYSGWSTVKTLNLNTTAAAAGVAEGQTTFPVLVRLTGAHAPIFVGSTAPGGADIRFSKPDGTRLAYELDRWSFVPGDTAAAFWVLLDAVDASAATPLRIHYGNGSATSKSNGSRVFSSANGYIGTWHMGNPTGGNAQTGIRPNAKNPGTNDAAPTSLTSGWVTKPGIIGLSDTLPGTGTTRSGSGFSLGVIPAGTVTTGSVTLSGWMAYGIAAANIYRSFVTTAQDTVFGTANAAALGTAGTGSTGRIGFQVANNSNTTWQSSANSVWAQNLWVYTSVTVRNGLANDSLYINGAFNMPNTATEQSLTDVNRPFNFIGKNFVAGDNTFNGKVDEVRMSNVARGRNWVKLEYKTQKPGAMPVFDLAYATPTMTVSNSGAAVTPNVPTVVGTSTRYTVSPALPNGLFLNGTSGTISGTPTTVSAQAPYTVTAYGDSSWSTTSTVNIEVTLAAPANLSYNPSTVTYEAGLPAGALAPQIGGGTVAIWSVSPDLPSGLSIDPLTGVISGVPAGSASAAAYTVTATNATGFVTAVVNITVTASENYATGWDSLKTFNVNTTAIGVTTGQGSFPVLVRLTSAHPSIFATAKSDGSDIRFSRPNGTRLPYQIERWNKAGQVAEIWVAVDTIVGNGVTPIRIHWGNAAAASKSDGGRVFNRSAGFEGDWHFSELAVDPAQDATLNGYNGVVNGAVLDTVGTIGRAKFFNNNIAMFYRMPGTEAPLSRVNFSQNGSYSVSAWVRQTTTAASRTIVSKSENQYALEARNSGTQWEFHEHRAEGDELTSAPTAQTVLGNWAHVVGVRNGTSQAIYVNGNLATSTIVLDNAVARARITDTALYVGKNPAATSNRPFLGMIDEVQISSTPRSADWIKLSYMTQKAASIPVSDLAYSAPSYSFVEELPITPIPAPTVVGTATRFSISPALPPTLTLNPATGAITGTAADGSAMQTYTVTAFGDSAWSTSTTFNLTITTAPPTGINYPMDSVITYVGADWGTNVPTSAGTINTWSVNPSLPAGMSLTTTGAIVGIPTGAAPRTEYVVTGTGPDGSDTETVVITVAPAPEDFSSWTSHRSITINTSATGANIPGTITKYPLLVRLGVGEANIFSEALAAGADVRFTKANNLTRLPHETVVWDAVNKKAEIWVQVDSVLGNNASQTIRMHWKKPGAVDSSNAGQVFSASNGFVSVWHLGNAADSSARPNAVTGAPPATPTFFGGNPTYTAPAGIIGMADTLRGSAGAAVGNTNHDYISILNGTAFPGFNGYTDFSNGYTMTAWVRPADVRTFTHFIDINSDNTASGLNTIYIGRNGVTAQLAYRNRTGATSNGGNANANAATDIVSDNATWQYFTTSKPNATVAAAVYKGRTAAGVTLVGAHTVIPSTARTYAYLGKSFDATNAGFAGSLDEIRIANTTRSADWVALDFETQKATQLVTDIGLQPPTLAYAPDSATYVQDAPITAVTPVVSGVSVTYTGSLPAGLVLNASTGVITGTPTGPSAKAKYTITASNLGGSVTDSIFIRVNPAAPTGMAYASNNLTLMVGTPLAPDSVTVTNLVDSFTVAPALPAGLSLDATTGVVSGTPSAITASADYVITATNVTGTAKDTVTILVNPAIPVVSYATPKIYTVGFAIDTLVVSSTGGPVDSFTVISALPAGLSLDKTTGKITGTPTTRLAAADYSVLASNVSGSDTASVNITVLAPPVITYATPKVFTVGLAITPVAPVSTGGPVTSYSISPNLSTQTGLTFTSGTGVISGSSSLSHAATDYTVIATGPDGLDTAVINITTTNEIPPIIVYADTLLAVKGSPIVALTRDTTGTGSGPIDSMTVSPALPAGLSLDKITGTISGTPTVVADMANYTVTAWGLGGTDAEVITITVKDIPPVINYVAGTRTYPVGTPITAVNVTSTGGAVVKYSVSPDLTTQTGLVLDTLTGAFSGTPTLANALTTYIVTATNSGGSDTGYVDIISHGAPLITTQPHDSTVISGANTSFTVAASASASGGALSYQWKKGGVNVAGGGTGTTYAPVSGAVIADTGTYTVVVTSTLNSTTTTTTSTAGILRVNVTPTFTSAQRDTTIASGTNANFSVVAATGLGSSSGTLSYQWKRGTTNVGTNASTIALTGATIADTGVYSVVVNRTLGTPATTTSATFTAGVLRVNATPVFSAQPRDTAFVSGATGTAFSVTASVVGGGTLSYQWKRGATNVGTNASTLALTSMTLADTGIYTVVATSTLNGVTTTTTSTAGILRVNVTPTFTSVQRDTTVVSGTGANFSVVAATGPGSSAGTLSYQWKRGTTNVGTNASTIALTGATIADTGLYTVVVTRSLGTPATTTSATFTAGVLRVNAAPVISAQPRDTTFIAAASGTAFQVTASVVGGGTLSYQWMRGATNVGTNAATLALASVTLADTGAYTVTVTSTLNGTTAATTSTVGNLRVNVAPTFTSAQRDTTITSGTAATFSVVAAAGAGSSAGTLSYQWRKNGTNVASGGTAATLTLAATTIADTGTYSVVVTRSLGTPVTTTNATFTGGVLRINAAPAIATQPRDTTVVAGATGTFTVGATSVGGGVLSYQWRKNGTNITTGGTSATLSLASSSLADTGAYSVVVTSTLNGTTTTTTSTAGNLRVNVAPTISTQPAATQTIVISTPTPVAFTVAAAAGVGSSAGTLSYQWKKNGVNVANGGTVSGATTATLNISAAAITDSGTYTVVITRTLNGTTTSTTSSNSRLEQPVAIMPDAFVIHVNGQERPYAFQLPAGTTTERLTLSILDVWGRRVWSESVNPVKDKLTEVSWNGKSANGRLASAGMYIVRIQVLNAGQTTTFIRKSVTLKPR